MSRDYDRLADRWLIVALVLTGLSVLGNCAVVVIGLIGLARS